MSRYDCSWLVGLAIVAQGTHSTAGGCMILSKLITGPDLPVSRNKQVPSSPEGPEIEEKK